MNDPAQSRSPASARPTMAQAIAQLLWQLGVRVAYGVCGREIVPLWQALRRSAGTAQTIATMHTRHESGAGFAAVGSWAFSGRPIAVFVTAGPGLTNVITSLEVARAAGAPLILLSPLTAPGERGRGGIQDTGPRGIHHDALHTPGRIFDLVARLDSAKELHAVAGHLAAGLASGRGFMAHLAIPMAMQEAPVDAVHVAQHRRAPMTVTQAIADEIAALLGEAPFAVWVGSGARAYAAQIRRLLDLTGAPAMSSPRGLGIVDRHPQFIGVTGNGGHPDLAYELARHAPQRTLVLGTGLGAATSGWSSRLVPARGFIHVDVDSGVFGRAYPDAETLGVQADVGELLDAILAGAHRLVRREPTGRRSAPPRLALVAVDGTPVHPAALMAAIQRVVIDGTTIPVLADPASAMFWAAHHLVFDEPTRWFVENRVGALGSGAAAVLGAAHATRGPALVIVGDHGLQMHNEINTAVRYGIPAIWLVLNDAGMGIVRAGMQADGWDEHDADFPATNFAAIAEAQGAAGIRVTSEGQLDAALVFAIACGGPCVIDVAIDPSARPPIATRTRGATDGSH
jgi:acetolactate synthase I/II/III large subunit